MVHHGGSNPLPSSTPPQDLKYPPVGMESMADNAASWPWFHLMNEAMEGRLAASAPVLTPITQEDDQHPDPVPSRHSRARQAAQDRVALLNNTTSSDYGHSDAYAVTDGGAVDECQRATAECDRALQEERLLGRGGSTTNRGLEREWEMVEMERAAVERDRAAVQAERVWLERERAALERDRAMIEQERATLGREREVLESERAMLMNTVTVVHTGHMNAMGM